jgi:hypothetical protein
MSGRPHDRIRDRAGSDVTVDHTARTITGKVAIPRPGPCPPQIVVDVGAGVRRAVACIGEAGHLGTQHCDRNGRTWT